MNENMEKMEYPFHGPKFKSGDKVKVIENISNDDINAIFTVLELQTQEYRGSGEHDDGPDYNYDLVTLKETSRKYTNDRLQLVEEN